MKITARVHNDDLIALEHVPRFGKPYTEYAYGAASGGRFGWYRPSFRPVTSNQLAAIDRLAIKPVMPKSIDAIGKETSDQP